MDTQNTTDTTVPPVPTPEAHSRAMPVWVGFVALAVIVIGALWYYYSASTGAPMTIETPAKVLLEGNPAYAEAYALNAESKFSEARAKYAEALQFAKNTAEEAQIKMKIAHTVRDEGNLVQAAQMYKEIGTQEMYSSMARAYALQALAMLFDYTGDAAVRTETFKGEPFSSLRVERNTGRSYRNLFELAAELYPLAIPELRAAQWYASVLLRETRGTRELLPETTAEYRSIVTENLQRADADLERTKDDPNEAILRPETLRTRAVLLGTMALAGYGSTQEAEEAFVTALQAHPGAPRDAYMRYWYAVFLADLGNRTDDIVALLAPIYSDGVYADSYFTSFLSSERQNQLGAKAQLQMLAVADPKFKEFLLSLDWTAADFE